jgi:hypothetical protein
MLFYRVLAKSIGIFKMKIILEESVDILRVRQILDMLSLYKHTTCLSSIKLIRIDNDKPLYDVEYVRMNGDSKTTLAKKYGEKIVV